MKARSSILCIVGAVTAVMLTLSGCAGVQGDREVSTADGEGAIGRGGGLFTGKRGGIVIHNDPWEGSTPGENKTAE